MIRRAQHRPGVGFPVRQVSLKLLDKQGKRVRRGRQPQAPERMLRERLEVLVNYEGQCLSPITDRRRLYDQRVGLTNVRPNGPARVVAQVSVNRMRGIL